ncbi:MAG: 3-dehydroquinate dehydratase [Bacteroidetes bacterium]|nr:3-dehydroquinate dehydratase [Bacteroidota bacterium]
MISVHIINGPNLNLLGKREVDVYGDRSFDSFLIDLQNNFPGLSITYAQSNVEGELVTMIQEAGYQSDFIVLNAAAYSHTSIAIADAVAAVPARTIGVHISNIYQREKERHIDLLAKSCEACLFGFGLEGYRLALEFIRSQPDSSASPDR